MKPTKSLLISFAGYPYTPSSLMPDNGLANLAGSLIREGHKTQILDYGTIDTVRRLRLPVNYRESAQYPPEKIRQMNRTIEASQREKTMQIVQEIVEYAKKEQVDFVGLKLWNGDGFTGSLMIAEELKKNIPRIYVFAGGPHVDWFRELIFRRTQYIDALVYEEGEETIVQLAEFVQGSKRLEEIPNLIFRNADRFMRTPSRRIKDLNSLASPCYDEDIYPAMRGNEKIKIFVIDESRGCNNICNFCIQPIKSGYLREKDPQKVVDEMEAIIKKHGIGAFKYAGSNTSTNLAEAIAHEIIRRKLKVMYTSFARISEAGQQDFELLRRAGCYALFYGVESGNQEILNKAINKRVTLSQIEHVVKETKKAGIKVVASIIVPSPFETEQTKKQTLEFLVKIDPDSVPVCPPGLVPGSIWTKHPDRFGFELESDFNFVMMCYKLKLNYPLIFWDLLPYKLDGKRSDEIFRESFECAQALEKRGFTTQIADDILLMAYYAEMSPRDFRDQNRELFLKGDYGTLEEIVKKINENIQKVQNNP